MRSHYKRLGNYIRQLNERNTNLFVTDLQGISFTKVFMPSVANVIGTDLSVYKVVRRNQFAYNPMHVGRDEVLPISMLNVNEAVIVSPAYMVFEIIDPDEMNPEYLMMWFSRPEFDRNAWFTTDSSVRGGFNWDDFCSMQLHIPTIEKQKEIVKEYNVIINRIALNNQLIQKLEEAAQAIYKQWFIDFEFPDENGYPFKTNGGEMIESDIGDIPKGWEYISIQSLIDRKILAKNQDGNHGEIHPKSSDYVENGIPFIMARDINNGFLNLDSCNYISRKQAKSLRIGFAKTDDVLFTHKGTMGRVAIVPEIEDFIVLTPQVTYYRILNKEKINKEFLYCLFNSENFQYILNEQSDQSTRKFISILNQRLIKILLPQDEVMECFGRIIKPILEAKRILALELIKMSSFLEILSFKMTKV